MLTGVAYVLFPELAALSYDVFTRPKGTWAKAPLMLVVTPFLAAVAGILIEQHLSYGFTSVLLSIAIALLIIKTLNSPVAPAISAGLLPVVLGEGSWWYPVSILFGTASLVISIWLAKVTGMRFILFPPLVVIGYEMFAHSEVCPGRTGRSFLPLPAC
jgi:hypothetical protein